MKLTEKHPIIFAVTDAVNRLEQAEAANAPAEELARLKELVQETARFQTRVLRDESEWTNGQTIIDRVKLAIFNWL